MPPQEATLTADASDSGFVASELADVLALFDKVIERRTTVPALGCVLLNAENGRLAIYGTDLDMELSTQLPYSGPPFTALVSHRALTAAMRSIEDALGFPAFAISSDKLIIRGGAATFTLNTLKPKEYHAPTPREVIGSYELDRDVFASLIRSCRPGISTEETRYYLNGLSIVHREGEIEVAATDGHRLHVATAKVAIDKPLPQVIVPRRAVACMVALLDDQLGLFNVGVHLQPLTGVFEIGKWTLRTCFIDGTFPDYTRVVPKDFKGSFTCRCDDMISALGAAQRMRDVDWKAIKFEPKTGRLSFRAPQFARFETTVAGVSEGDPPDEIGFNPLYAQDLLRAGPDGHVTFKMGDNATPMLIEFMGDTQFFGVLMPMRVPA